jgi:hypothetical protein
VAHSLNWAPGRPGAWTPGACEQER